MWLLHLAHTLHAMNAKLTIHNQHAWSVIALHPENDTQVFFYNIK